MDDLCEGISSSALPKVQDMRSASFPKCGATLETSSRSQTQIAESVCSYDDREEADEVDTGLPVGHKKAQVLVLGWIYGITLLAGALNVYAVKILGTPVTHHTGNATGIAVSIYEKTQPSMVLLLLIACFFMGSVLSGILNSQRDLYPKRRYGACIICGGILLAALEMNFLADFRLYIISFWMGVQNGLFMKYKGALVRTSHVTGTLTDAGFALGAFLNGQKSEFWKVKFYLLSFVSFILGGVFGYAVLDVFPSFFLLIGSLYAACGVVYLQVNRDAARGEKKYLRYWLSTGQRLYKTSSPKH